MSFVGQVVGHEKQIYRRSRTPEERHSVEFLSESTTKFSNYLQYLQTWNLCSISYNRNLSLGENLNK